MHLRQDFTRLFLLVSVLLPCTALFIWVGAAGAESASQPGAISPVMHLEVKGVVAKVHPSMFFIRPVHGLQLRTISIIKAERIGLHEAGIGDHVTLLVDEGNVLVDAYRTGAPLPEHRLIVGELQYADQTWEEIKLSTPEGVERYDVDPLAGTKLSGLSQGAHVEVELDADNTVVYIQRAH